MSAEEFDRLLDAFKRGRREQLEEIAEVGLGILRQVRSRATTGGGASAKLSELLFEWIGEGRPSSDKIIAAAELLMSIPLGVKRP